MKGKKGRKAPVPKVVLTLHKSEINLLILALMELSSRKNINEFIKAACDLLAKELRGKK